METLTQGRVPEDRIATIIREAQDAVDRAVREYFSEHTIIEENAQHGHQSGNQLTDVVRETVQSWLADNVPVANKPSNDVAVEYGHLSGRTKPKSVADQIVLLTEALGELPQLGIAEVSERSYVIPHWSLFDQSYHGAIKKMLLELAKRWQFYNLCDVELEVERISETPQKKAAMQEILDQQKSSLLLVPAEFGIISRNTSGSRAEISINSAPVRGVWEIGLMLLCHQEPVVKGTDIWIECPDDKFIPIGEPGFSSSPGYLVADGGIELVVCRIDDKRRFVGSTVSLGDS
ncbi:MAG: hypothetical protein WCW36_03430 [Candidatus Paceibacterota bacterium]